MVAGVISVCLEVFWVGNSSGHCGESAGLSNVQYFYVTLCFHWCFMLVSCLLTLEDCFVTIYLVILTAGSIRDQ